MAKSSTYPSSLLATVWTVALIVLSVYAGLWTAENGQWLLATAALPQFLAVPLKYQAEAPIIRTLSGVLGGFLTFFALAYVLKSILDALRLGWVNVSLGWRARHGGFDAQRPPAGRGFWFYPLFNRLWQDYVATLHAQREAGEGGEERIRYRATVPAELYFNTDMLVDAPMRVEFFRHLPGILTGAGIVSTFAGVLLGLTEFNPTVEPEQVTTQLKHLFTGVSTAFVASFFAIFAAIVVTVIEKLLIGWRYGQVTELHGRLGDLFQSGVEPEYLAQMARAGLLSGDRLERLALALPQPGEGPAAEGPTVADLQGVVTALAETVRASQAQLTRELEASLRESLSQPLREMSGVLRQLLELQTSQGGPALVAGGIDKLTTQVIQDGARGLGMLTDIHGSVGAVRETLGRMEAGVGAVREEVARQGERDAEALARLTEAVGRMSEQDAAAFERLTEVVGRMSEQDAAAFGRLAEAVGRLGEQDAASLERLMQLISQQAESGGTTLARVVEAVERLSEQDGVAFGRLHESLGQLGEQGVTAFNLMVEAINQMGEREGAGIAELAATLAQIREQGGVGFDNLAAAVRALAEEDAVGVQRLAAAAEAQGLRQEAALGQLSRDMSGTLHALAQTHQEAARDRDAFLLARMADSHGELAVRLDSAFRAGLDAPVEKIVASVESVREEQVRLREAQGAMGRELNEALLGAFAAHLREMVSRLVDQLGTLGDRLSNERQAMEENIRHLLTGMTEAARAGGERLADQMQHALAGAESRQDQLLESLSLLTANLRGDIALIQEHIRQSSQEVSADLARRTQELILQSGLETGTKVQASAEEVTRALTGAIQEMAEQRASGEAARDQSLVARLEADNRGLADQMRASLQQELEQTAKVLVQSIQVSGETHSQQAKALADMMLATLASKMEDRFGGLSNGIVELRQRLGEEQVAVQRNMQEWLNNLAKSNHAEAQALADRIRGVMEDAANRHHGMLGAIDDLNQGLKGEMDRVRDSLLEKSSEATDALSRHMDEVVTNTTNEQTVFIHMLGERLETLRRQLRVK